MTELALNIAYVLYVASTLFRTVVKLRVMMIATSVAFIVYGVFLGSMSVIVWNVLFGAMHAGQLFILWRKHRAIDISPEEEAIWHERFVSLSRLDFYTLWSVGERRFEAADTVVIDEGQKQESLALILTGDLEVRRCGEVLAKLAPGALIGERSFVTDQPASATVRTINEVELHLWSHEKIHALEMLCPAAHQAMAELIGQDLARKLR